jgi:hypothetical protein
MYSTPHIGDSITYRLRLSEKPVESRRLWHGVVEKVWQNYYRVSLTDEGCEGGEKIVIHWQIVAIEGGPRYEPSRSESIMGVEE